MMTELSDVIARPLSMILEIMATGGGAEGQDKRKCHPCLQEGQEGGLQSALTHSPGI